MNNGIEKEYKNLEDLEGLTWKTEDGCFVTYSDRRAKNLIRKEEGLLPLTKGYQDWEKEIATPALIAAGYNTMGIWHTGDGDSFGPLSRFTVAHKDDRTFVFTYG